MLALALVLLGTDVYQAVRPDGSLVFTDSPATGGYELISSDRPVPVPSHVSVRRFPSLDLWDAQILRAAERYDVSSALLKAVMLAESAMNPRALSDKGAMGLMQLMPGTAAAMGLTDPWDPAQNIDGGARYIREQLDRFGDIRSAVAAYHAGPGNVARYGGIPPFASTRAYVARVYDLYHYFLDQRPLSRGEALVPEGAP